MKSLSKIFLVLILMSFLVSLAGCYSCRTWHTFWNTGPVEPGTEELFFFDSHCRPVQVVKAKPVTRTVAKPKPAVPECGPYKVTRTYPSCAVIELHKKTPAEVHVNAPFSYEINVRNLTDMLVDKIIVTEQLPSNFNLDSTAPAAKAEGKTVIWTVGQLKGGESKKLVIKGTATGSGCITSCATVTYKIPACANIKVVEPKLRLQKTAPNEVLLCDAIPVKLTVTNTGTGSAENVKISDTLPDGLKTADGKTSFNLDAGTLSTGEAKQFNVTLKAAKTGKFVNRAVATSAGGLKSEASTTTVVRQPVLEIVKTAPEKRYLGRPIRYEITVKNKGDADASGLVIEDRVPAGATFVSADSGGTMAAGNVTWRIASLKPGQQVSVSMTVMPQKEGLITNTATAKATCAEITKASAKTSVEGIPAILLEVIDIDDPIEVGSQTAYVITATNQGSSVGTNISIVCELEENMQYVSSTGASLGKSAENKVTFAPLPKLAPKQKAVWRVVVKSVKAGDVRFKVIMNTDQLERPVQETEATHLYE